MDCLQEAFYREIHARVPKVAQKMNLVQMKHIKTPKASIGDFNAQVNAKSKMDVFIKKCIFFDGLQKWMVNALFKVPKISKSVAKSSKLQRKLKYMALKGNKKVPFNKIA